MSAVEPTDGAARLGRAPRAGLVSARIGATRAPGLLHLVATLVVLAPAGWPEEARAQVRSAPATLTLALGGDVYLDSPIRNTLDRRADQVGLRQAYQELLADVAPSLHAADLAVVNLETPISTRYRERGPGEPPTFNAPPELLEALVEAGVDVISLANNHAYDQGYQGLRDTVEQARRLGLTVVGAGRTPDEACGPVTVATARGDVSICAWTQGFNRLPRPAEAESLAGGSPLRVAFTEEGTLARCLAEARARSSLVVASIHWATGVWHNPGRRERELVLALADGGADVILGHGSHRPAPAPRLQAADGRTVQVFFSLGNLVGAMGIERREWAASGPSVRDSAIAVVRAGDDGRGGLAPLGMDLVQLWMSGILTDAPWWSGGRQELIRPLSVAQELRRIDEADCGEPCRSRASGYHRRLAAFRKAVTFEGPWPDRPEPSPAVALREPEPAAARLDPRAPPPALPPAPPAPSATAAVEQPPTGGEGLDLPALLRGVTLPIGFGPDRLEGEIRDEAVVARIVELIQAHRDHQVLLIGHGVRGEVVMPLDRLGRRRAMWIAHELSSRGPSRRRFSWDDGPPLPTGEEGRVVLRLTRGR